MSGTAAGQHVRKTLEHYGPVVRGAVLEALPRKEPRGYLYDLVADYPRRGGRMLRPCLCLATARLFGATVEEALPAAVSIELLHNALLIHDDVEDESDERRGKPTLHRVAGGPLAINAGDSLAFLSLRPLLGARERLGGLLTLRALEEIERMAQETAEGQAIELGWRRDNAMDVGEADYLEMVLRKTCWLTTILPIRLGALIGSRDEADLDRLIRFGFFVGAAFQIQDDLLNLEGDPERYGKELAGDLLEGKRTLMLIHLFQQATEDERQRLRDALRPAREERRADEVRWMRERLDAYGCLDYARQIAHGLAGAARHEFEGLYGPLPDSRDKRFIEELVTWVFHRS